MSLPAISTRRLSLLLGGLAMFGPFSIDTIFPAFSQLAQRLHVDDVVVQQTVSVYMLAYAVMGLAHGALADAFGRKRVILVGLCVFTLASIGCALSRDMTTLLIFRALQGMSAGVGTIVGRAVIRDLYDGPLAQKLMSQVSMVFSIAPAIAPIIGGWILGVGAGWAMIFWFLTAFSALLLVATATFLPETHPVSERTPLSVHGLASSYKDIGLNSQFQLLSASAAMLFCGIFLYISSAPVFVMELLHKTEQDFAWLFIPTIGGIAVGSWVSGRMAGRFEATVQARLGFACCVLGGLASVAYSASVAQLQVPWAVLPIFLMGLGMGVAFPILTLAVLDLYPHHRGLAASLQVSVQLIVSSVVAGALSPMVAHQPVKLALVAAAFFVVAWLLWAANVRVALRRARQGKVVAQLDSVSGS